MRARLVLAFGYLNGKGWFTGQHQKKKKITLFIPRNQKRNSKE